MPIRSCRSSFAHYVLALAAASLIPFMISACAARRSTSGWQPLRPPPERLLSFENSTIEPVTIFLEERGSRWLVGYALPGQRTNLRVPPYSSNPAGREFVLVAVPATARRMSLGRSTAPLLAPVTSDRVPGNYLTTVRWKLTGNWLVSLPLQREP